MVDLRTVGNVVLNGLYLAVMFCAAIYIIYWAKVVM